MTNFKQSKHAISVHDGWQKKKKKTKALPYILLCVSVDQVYHLNIHQNLKQQ